MIPNLFKFASSIFNNPLKQLGEPSEPTIRELDGYNRAQRRAMASQLKRGVTPPPSFYTKKRTKGRNAYRRNWVAARFSNPAHRAGAFYLLKQAGSIR